MALGMEAMQAMGNSGKDKKAQPTKLFIGGITRNTTTKTLRDHFCIYDTILDCVAMRLPDGKPRGFGYVTLASSAAADRVLAVPQVIDGRVVDMKRAVPESSGASPTASAKPTTDLLGLGLGEPMRIPQAAYYPWMENAHTPFSAAPLLGTSPLAPQTGMPLLGTSPLAASNPSPAGTLSACAPEFIPAGAASPTSPLSEPAVVTSSLGSPNELERPARKPLGQLTDITNVIKGQADAKGSALAKKPAMSKQHSETTALVTNTSKASKVSASALEILADSCGEGEASDDSMAKVPQPGYGPLPSVGSAEHAAGTCKRCNFFAKGRCQRGQSCTFCHFPHEKRKLSRQEKRYRRAAYGAEVEDESSEADSDSNVQKIMAYSVLPGLPPIQATALPGPLALPGSNAQLAKGYAAATPSLPPGLDVWQPDEEVSPQCVMPCNATPLSTPHSVGKPSTPNAAAGMFLSTVPVAHSAPQTAAPSLAPTPTNANSSKFAAVDASAEPVKIDASGLVSMGTQTDDVDDKICSRCQKLEVERAASKRMAAHGGA